MIIFCRLQRIKHEPQRRLMVICRIRQWSNARYHACTVDSHLWLLVETWNVPGTPQPRLKDTFARNRWHTWMAQKDPCPEMGGSPILPPHPANSAPFVPPQKPWPRSSPRSNVPLDPRQHHTCLVRRTRSHEGMIQPEPPHPAPAPSYGGGCFHQRTSPTIRNVPEQSVDRAAQSPSTNGW